MWLQHSLPHLCEESSLWETWRPWPWGNRREKACSWASGSWRHLTGGFSDLIPPYITHPPYITWLTFLQALASRAAHRRPPGQCGNPHLERNPKRALGHPRALRGCGEVRGASLSKCRPRYLVLGTAIELSRDPLIFGKLPLGLLWHFFLGSRTALIKLYPLYCHLCVVCPSPDFRWGGVASLLMLFSFLYPFPVSLQAQLLTSSMNSSDQFYLLFQIEYKIFWQLSKAVFLHRDCSLESAEEFLKPRLLLRPMKSDSGDGIQAASAKKQCSHGK